MVAMETLYFLAKIRKNSEDSLISLTSFKVSFDDP